MREVLRLLNCYYEDMRYGTPEFGSEEELEAYLEGVAYTIGEFIEETRE